MNNVILIAMSMLWILTSCSSIPGEMHRMSVEQNQDLFRSRAIEFVRGAQKGDVEKMLRYTSSKTLRNSGLDEVRRIYLNEVIPAFAGGSIKWSQSGVVSRDLSGNAGYRFDGCVSGKNHFCFEIFVFGEGGELMIVTIRKK